MKTCYVIAREGVSGGTGTLSCRLLTFLHEHDYQCAYFCCENNSPQTMHMIEQVVDELVISDDITFSTQFEEIRIKYDSFVFLTYSIGEYLAVDKLRKKYNSISRSILYVVHGYAFSYPPELKLSKFKSLLYSMGLIVRYRKLVKALLISNSILFMDLLSVQETEKTLKLSIDRSLIQHLPFFIKQYSDNYWDNIKRHIPFTIGTMCRMEFPFKGYVLGLIDIFACLQKDYNVKLCIVGDGPNVEEFKSKINTLSSDIKDKIVYRQSVAYSEIDTFYSQCDLALGMGTVLLDAANHNVLALPVNLYTRELEIGSLFMDNIEWLCMKGEPQDFETMVKSILELSDKDFAELIHKQYDRLKLNYNINTFAECFVNSTIGNRGLNFVDRFLFDFSTRKKR